MIFKNTDEVVTHIKKYTNRFDWDNERHQLILIYPSCSYTYNKGRMDSTYLDDDFIDALEIIPNEDGSYTVKKVSKEDVKNF